MTWYRMIVARAAQNGSGQVKRSWLKPNAVHLTGKGANTTNCFLVSANPTSAINASLLYSLEGGLPISSRFSGSSVYPPSESLLSSPDDDRLVGY
jgi:hypothetical protein